MEENNIIKKLGMLKEIKPSEGFVSEAKKAVMAEAPVFDQFTSDLYNTTNEKSSFGFSFLHLNKLMVPVASLVFVLFSGSFTLSASQSSLPGDTLYSVKIASENATLAVASPEKKAEIEIQQAGKRLEEWVEISKKTSDTKQGEKLKQLAVNFEEKVNNAQDGLQKIEDTEKKAQIAKVINVQTEKYTEAWVDANENLTEVVKNDVSSEFASAIDSSKKVNLDSLAVRVEVMTDDDKEEITAIVKEKAEEKEVISEEEENLVITEEAVELSPIEEETSNESPIEEVVPETVQTEQNLEISEVVEEIQAPMTIDQEKEELLNILDDLNNINDGEVKSDSDEKVDSDETEDVVQVEEKIMPVPVE